METKEFKLIRNLAILGAFFIIIVGALWHFLYVWSGNNFLVGLITPVNESVWEHMKLVFWPILLFAILVEYWYLKENNNYLFSLCFQQYFIIIFIICFFYFYTYFTKTSIFSVDIALFIIAVIIAKFISVQILIGKTNIKDWLVSLILIILLGSFMILTTVYPPKLKLFLDNNTNTYGINKILASSDNIIKTPIANISQTYSLTSNPSPIDSTNPNNYEENIEQAENVVKNFIEAKKSRDFNEGKPYMTQDYAKNLNQEIFAGVSSPSIGRYEIISTSCLDNNDAYVVTCKVYQNLQNEEVGYSENIYYLKKEKGLLLVDQVDEGSFIQY